MTASLEGPRLAPASGGKAKNLVVFLHGYGADGNDLIGLAQHWAGALPDTAFASPHAPERCAMSPTGYQWFGLTMRDPDEYVRGVEVAAPILNAFLDAELERHGLSDENLALVGFSQGTMMSLHVGPRRSSQIAGIMGYSGLLAAPERLKQETTHRPPVSLVHGDRDEMLPVQLMFEASNALGDADFPVEWHVSQGIGHGIDPDGLAIGGRFLNRVFG